VQITKETRFVEIDGVDVNPCCGTHVPNLSHLQLVHLTRTEKSRGRTRLFFLAGTRARETLSRTLQLQRKLTAALSCSADSTAESVFKLQDDLRLTNKSNARLLKQIASLQAESLTTQAKDNNSFVSCHLSEDFAATGTSYMSSLADEIRQRDPNAFVFLSDASSSQFLIAGAPDTVNQLAPRIASILGGRGGGKNGRYQGKATTLDKRNEVIDLLSAEIHPSTVAVALKAEKGAEPSPKVSPQTQQILPLYWRGAVSFHNYQFLCK